LRAKLREAKKARYQILLCLLLCLLTAFGLAAHAMQPLAWPGSLRPSSLSQLDLTSGVPPIAVF